VANHFRLDLDLVELLAGVDTDDASNHLGNNNHVSQVSLDEVGLLVGLGLLLGLSELLDKAHGAALQAAVNPSAGAGVDDISELVRGEVEKVVKVDSSVREPAEDSSLLDLGGLLSVVFVSHDRGCVLIQGFAYRRAGYRRAHVVAVLESFGKGGRVGWTAALLISGSRVFVPFDLHVR